jgi:transposase InsO family protein
MIEHGSRFRVLSLIDKYTQRCLVLRAGWSLRAKDVIDILEESIATYGSPKHIRSDNGPEFIAYAI